NTPGIIWDLSLFFLKHFIHEKGLNKLLSSNKEICGVDFAKAVLDYFQIKYRILGEVPNEKRYIFTSNHPLGGIDANIFIDAASKKNKDLKIIVSDYLMTFNNYHSIFLPIGSNGNQKREYSKNISEALRSESQILIFPAGSVSRKKDGKVTDSSWSPSVINWSLKYKRDIAPVYIDGKNSKLFYSLSDIRKNLGIKMNLEEFLLPRETFNQKGKTFNIVFGEPIPYQKFTNELTPKEWASIVYDKVYSLEKLI
ncbi:MAG: glycerol acyltransferase, partial [archaeon]|nr:glycerol acyltransferase [archaeon]